MSCTFRRSTVAALLAIATTACVVGGASAQQQPSDAANPPPAAAIPTAIEGCPLPGDVHGLIASISLSEKPMIGTDPWATLYGQAVRAGLGPQVLEAFRSKHKIGFLDRIGDVDLTARTMEAVASGSLETIRTRLSEADAAPKRAVLLQHVVLPVLSGQGRWDELKALVPTSGNVFSRNLDGRAWISAFAEVERFDDAIALYRSHPYGPHMRDLVEPIIKEMFAAGRTRELEAFLIEEQARLKRDAPDGDRLVCEADRAADPSKATPGSPDCRAKAETSIEHRRFELFDKRAYVSCMLRPVSDEAGREACLADLRDRLARSGRTWAPADLAWSVYFLGPYRAVQAALARLGHRDIELDELLFTDTGREELQVLTGLMIAHLAAGDQEAANRLESRTLAALRGTRPTLLDPGAGPDMLLGYYMRSAATRMIDDWKIDPILNYIARAEALDIDMADTVFTAAIRHGDRQTADLVQSKATYWDFYLRRALFEHAEGHDAEAAAAMTTARALVCRPRRPVDGRPPTVDGGIAMRLIRAELVLSGRTPDDKSLWR